VFGGLTDWLSGSGGVGGDTFSIIAHSGKSRLREAAEPLSDWSRCWAALECAFVTPDSCKRLW